ncbi:L-arabinose transport system permease protein AraQ [compost metagenome]
MCYLFILIFAVFCLFPFLLLIMSSITEENTLVMEGFSILPSKLSLNAYRLLLQTRTIYDAYKVTIFVTVMGTGLSMILSSAMAYALSVKTFKLRGSISLYMYFTMLFGGGLVPSYILISKGLHLNNNIWVLILPALISPWNTFLLRNFFNSVPDSLAESAKIDGANDVYILFKIIIPISLPAMATISLFYALSYWNEWFRAMLYISNEQLYPLQYLIMSIIRNMNYANSIAAQTQGSIGYTLPTYTVRMATTVVTIGPIVLLYPFLQKYFVKGLTVGSIKG